MPDEEKKEELCLECGQIHTKAKAVHIAQLSPVDRKAIMFSVITLLQEQALEAWDKNDFKAVQNAFSLCERMIGQEIVRLKEEQSGQGEA